jgi:hypothetical protein
LTHFNDQIERNTKATENKIRNISYLESKSGEYRNTLAGLQEALERSGVTPSIYNASLVQIHEEVDSIHKLLAPKQNTLNVYNDLPADLSLAKIKVEDARTRLYRLEEQLSIKVNEFIS